MSSRLPHFGTLAVHAGNDPERWEMNQVVPPISLTTTYKQPAPGEMIGHDYSRLGNPNRDVLQSAIAALEDAQYCRVFASGLAAVNAIVNHLHVGDHVICTDNVYGGTQLQLREIFAGHQNITVSFLDLTDLNNLKTGLRPETKVCLFKIFMLLQLVWIESPSNPLLKVVDIAGAVKIAKSVRPDILVAVDNTFATPYFQRPLALGADLVMHSVTKYLNGHLDVLMGAFATNSKALDDHLFFQQRVIGAVPSPFDCYLVNRGLKTLHLRMEAHYRNGLAVAQFLEADPRIEKVFYPPLPSHPQHEVHKKQASGMSGMVSFYVKGTAEQTSLFLSSLKLVTLGESLGGVTSLVQLSAKMSHKSVPPEVRAKLGITDTLVRLSVGIEDAQDIINDLDQALTIAIPNIA